VKNSFYRLRLILWGIIHFTWPKFVSKTHLHFKSRNPKTFNEKILHRMSKSVNAAYTDVVGRLSLRNFVEERVGDQYLPKLLQTHSIGTEIAWELLPNEFVIKVNHGSGSVLISNKVSLDGFGKSKLIQARWKRFYLHPSQVNINKSLIITLLDSWMQMDYSYSPVRFPEPWYSQVPRLILIEELLHESGQLLPRDYKFFVFSGVVRMIRVDTPSDFGRKSMSHFDENWNLIGTTFSERRNQVPYKQTEPIPAQPNNFHEMKEIASLLGRKFDFVRVDLYNTDEGIRVGEMTLAPTSGQGYFSLAGLNETLGSYW
jgi:hypothetical protein